MAYNRRNDNEGRVIGFKDGMPVYKRGGNKPAAPKKEHGDRKPRYNDRDRDGKYDGSDDYSGKRPYNNRKSEPREGGFRRDEGFRRGSAEGRPDKRFGDEREGGFRRDEGFRERPGFREGVRGDRTGNYSRPERTGGRPLGPRGDQGFGKPRWNKSDLRPPRERTRYENLKPLPADIPPVRENADPAELPNIIMGRNPVKEAIKSDRSIDRILVTKEHDGSLNEIRREARRSRR